MKVKSDAQQVITDAKGEFSAQTTKVKADLGAVQTALDAERSQRSPQSIAALRSTIQTLVHDVRTMVNDVSAGC
jgi:hypothetical protein